MSAASTALKIPFGYKDGRYYGPMDVENGDKCGCICPGCDALLRANQGSESSTRRAYFSHQVKGDCVNGYETAVHRYAKQIIADELSVLLPEHRVICEPIEFTGNPPYSFRGEDFVGKEKLETFERSELEKTVHPFRPDVTLHKSGCTVYVEICVTHSVGEEKAAFFKDSNLLEIYLKEVDRDLVFDIDAFKEFVINEASREWIHCNLFNEEIRNYRELQTKRAEQAYEKYRRKIEQQKKAQKEKTERERKAHEEELKKKYEIEQRKLKNRSDYQKELNELENLYAPGVLEARCKGLFHDAQENIEAVKKYFNHDGKIPTALTVMPDGGWVFKTHWIVWQAYVYAKYIQQATLGSIIIANDIKKDVVNRYGVLDTMVTLNNLKQQQKMQGRNRGEYYAGKGAWFFTDEENRKIISPYIPIITFLSSLEKLELLERDDPRKGVFTVKQNCVETAYNILNARRKAQQESIDRAIRARREAQEEERRKTEDEKKRKREALDAHQEKRIKEISEQVRYLFDDGVKNALQCVFCASVATSEASKCLACGNYYLEPVELSTAFVETVEFRLRCDPRIGKL